MKETFKPNRTVKTDPQTLARIRRRLQARNRRFKVMSRAEQRVAIAKDVIAQLDAKKIVARSTYFSPPQKVEDKCRARYGDEKVRELDLSEVTAQVKCEVCGIGAVFLSTVEFNDKLKVKEFFSYDPIHGYLSDRDNQVEYLGKWFSSKQLDEIEEYFENGSPGCDEAKPWSSSPIQREVKREKRLRMIMENIISNNGKFDPYKGKHKCDEDGSSEETY